MRPLPEGFVEGYHGPVRVVSQARGLPDAVTVGSRVMAWWQRFGYVLGNGTVAGFAVHPQTGWIKVKVDYDYGPRVEWWDWDRTIRVVGHWDDETVEESVGRWHRELVRRGERDAPEGVRT